MLLFAFVGGAAASLIGIGLFVLWAAKSRKPIEKAVWRKWAWLLVVIEVVGIVYMWLFLTREPTP